jgi:hypothetical protein
MIGKSPNCSISIQTRQEEPTSSTLGYMTRAIEEAAGAESTVAVDCQGDGEGDGYYGQARDDESW